MKFIAKLFDAICLVFAFLTGKRVQRLSDENVQQKAELKAGEAYALKKQDVMDEYAKEQAMLDSLNIPDSWPDSGVIKLPKVRSNPKKPSLGKLSTKRK